MNTILWLASWYPSKIAPFDGDFIQRHAKAVALTQPVHVVHVVKDEQGIVCNRLVAEDTQKGNLRETVIYYKPFKTGLKPVDKLISFVTYYRVYSSYLKKHIEKHGKPALVHLHVVMRAGMMALWLQRKYSLAYVVTEHWTGYNRQAAENFYRKNLFFRYVTKMVFRQASLFLPVSNDLARTVIRDIQPVEYSVVHNVADTSLFYDSNFQPPVFRFVHVSSMTFQKNIPGLLRCLNRLLLRPMDWEFVMIGPADEKIKHFSNELGLQQKVSWLGELSYEKVANQMRQASACVLFSRYENLPCVLIEAACCGIPVIAPRLGGTTEIVDDFNGLLISAGSEDQLLQAMVNMRENYNKYDKKKISDTAAGLFSYENTGKKITATYRNILRL